MTDQKALCAGCGAAERLTLVNAPTHLYSCRTCRLQPHDVLADLAWLQETRPQRVPTRRP